MNYNIFTWIYNIPCNVIIFPCVVIIFPCAVIIFPCAVIVFPCAVIIFPCAVKTFLRYDDVDGDKAQVHQREVYFLWKQGGRGCVNTSDGISALNCITPPPSSQPFDFYLNLVLCIFELVFVFDCAFVQCQQKLWNISFQVHFTNHSKPLHLYSKLYLDSIYLYLVLHRFFVFLGIKVID